MVPGQVDTFEVGQSVFIPSSFPSRHVAQPRVFSNVLLEHGVQEACRRHQLDPFPNPKDRGANPPVFPTVWIGDDQRDHASPDSEEPNKQQALHYKANKNKTTPESHLKTPLAVKQYHAVRLFLPVMF